MKQLTLKKTSGWGGRREGAGRKPSGGRVGVPHRRRAKVTRHTPVHVTLRLERRLGRMRTHERFEAVKGSLAAARQRLGFRVTDWSLMNDHLHLIVEADDAARLGAGMKGLAVRLARNLNRLATRKGRVIVDRYHARPLTTPTEVRNAIAYVLNNARHHGFAVPHGRPDLFSSGASFDGWSTEPPTDPRGAGIQTTAPPRSWLRRVGWRRRGLVRLDEVPKGSS